MRYNFDEIVDRKNTDSHRWNLVNKLWKDKDGLPLSTADMDFKSPIEIIQAIKDRADHGIFGYAFIPDSYYEAVINWVKSRHNWEIKREWLICTSGVVFALNTAIVTFTNPEDSILIQTPVYPPFFSIIKNNNRNLIENQLIYKDGRYTIDFDILEKQLSSGVKMIILCSPHNPVGRVWSYEELKTVGELCIKYNVLMVSDEIHSDIVYSKIKHTPLSSISEEIANNSITCISPTKTFNIPGVGISTAIIPNKKLRDEYNKTLIKMAANGTHNIFSILASEIAYRHGAEWLDQLLPYLESNANLMEMYIRENIPAIKFSKPEGTYLGWLDCRQLGIEHENLRDYFVLRAKVELQDGRLFGSNGLGFLRFNFATPRSVVKEALERIKASL
ncbi:MAG TPA: pyridoxal phosphate-dependent aminotransferase [Clostridiaceae bacterium]|nr:pyridoxal phosphate-dependent aminotransferase [Clostridiaceae bacterium]